MSKDKYHNILPYFRGPGEHTVDPGVEDGGENLEEAAGVQLQGLEVSLNTAKVVRWDKYYNILPSFCAQERRQSTRELKTEKQSSKRPPASNPKVSKLALTPQSSAVAQALDSPICASKLYVCRQNDKSVIEGAS